MQPWHIEFQNHYGDIKILKDFVALNWVSQLKRGEYCMDS